MWSAYAKQWVVCGSGLSGFGGEGRMGWGEHGEVPDLFVGFV
jgi:hypothetical protein